MKVINPLEMIFYRSTHRPTTTATYFDKNKVLRLAPTNPVETPEDMTTTGMRDNWNPETSIYEGLLVEPTRTNYIYDNPSLTNTTKITAIPLGYATLSFYGTGSIKLEGPFTTFTLNGNANSSPTFSVDSAVASGSPAGLPCPWYRVSKTFVVTDVGLTTITITGTVRFAQLEVGDFPTSIIITTGATSPVTRQRDQIFASDQGILTGAVQSYDMTLGDAYLFPSLAYTSPSIYAKWTSGVSYSIGQKTILYGCIYQSLTNHTSSPSNQPYAFQANTNWTLIGYDNPILPFVRGTSGKCTMQPDTSSNIGVISFVVPQGSNSLALHGVKCKKITVVINNLKGKITTKSFLDSAVDGNFNQDLYLEFDAAESSSTATPAGDQQGTVVTLRLEPDTSTFFKAVAIEEIVTGYAIDLGKTQYGLTTSITDYSKKETDAFGNVSFVVRGFSKKISARTILEKSRYNLVSKVLSQLRAAPTSWVATDDTGYSVGAIAYGYYKDFSIDISYPSTCACSLEIEGLASS